MKQTLLRGLVTAFVIVALCISTSLANVFMFGNCDPKFGCWGIIWFVGFIATIGGVISAAANVFVSLTRISKSISIRVSVIAGVILTPLLFNTFDWGINDTVMLFGWFSISAFVVVLLSFIIPEGKREIT